MRLRRVVGVCGHVRRNNRTRDRDAANQVRADHGKEDRVNDFKVGDHVAYGVTIGSTSPRPKNSWGGDLIPLIGEIIALEGGTARVRALNTGQVNEYPVEKLKSADEG